MRGMLERSCLTALTVRDAGMTNDSLLEMSSSTFMLNNPLSIEGIGIDSYRFYLPYGLRGVNDASRTYITGTPLALSTTTAMLRGKWSPCVFVLQHMGSMQER